MLIAGHTEYASLYNLWGVIQQRVYQPQLYNVNELKCACRVAQWH